VLASPMVPTHYLPRPGRRKIAATMSEGALFRGVDRHDHIGSVRLHKVAWA
jgi:hypothetical protein